MTIWQNLITTQQNGRYGRYAWVKRNCNDHGGEHGALLYGLIGTYRLNSIDPEAYLRYLLSVLREWPSNKVAELLLWNVDLTNK